VKTAKSNVPKPTVQVHADHRAGLPGLTPLSDEPARGAGARMQRYLMQCAIEIMNAGRIPSISEVAEAAEVSRATAYRYFPTRSKLIAAVTEYSLGQVRTWRSANTDGRERVDELFIASFPRFAEFEVPLRAAAQLALEHEALHRAGMLKEDRYRRGYRRGILAYATEPLRETLGVERFERLLRALSLIFGIEPYVIIKDMWGGTNEETSDLARWIARAAIDASLREAKRGKGKVVAAETKKEGVTNKVKSEGTAAREKKTAAAGGTSARKRRAAR
jgi:AcrR family transcriptional regulator